MRVPYFVKLWQTHWFLISRVEFLLHFFVYSTYIVTWWQVDTFLIRLVVSNSFNKKIQPWYTVCCFKGNMTISSISMDIMPSSFLKIVFYPSHPVLFNVMYPCPCFFANGPTFHSKQSYFFHKALRVFMKKMKNPVSLFFQAFLLKTFLNENSFMHCIGQQLELKRFQTSSVLLTFFFFLLWKISPTPW